MKVSLVENLDKPKGINDGSVSKEEVEKKNADERVKILLPVVLAAGAIGAKILVGVILLFLLN